MLHSFTLTDLVYTLVFISLSGFSMELCITKLYLSTITCALKFVYRMIWIHAYDYDYAAH